MSGAAEKKVVPDEDLLSRAYRAFHRSQQLRVKFKEVEEQFGKEAAEMEIPGDLKEQVRAVLDENDDLLGRRNPDRARRNAVGSCAEGESVGQEEVGRLHRRR